LFDNGREVSDLRLQVRDCRGVGRRIKYVEDTLDEPDPRSERRNQLRNKVDSLIDCREDLDPLDCRTADGGKLLQQATAVTHRCVSLL
jgi:hypothetical protein